MLQKQLGKRIAALRNAKGLSQEALAAKSGYSTEFISLIERGRNAPSFAGLGRIAKALRLEIKDLFDFNKGGDESLTQGRPASPSAS